MKPLLMLDHAMLWMVRISAPSLLCLGIYYYARQIIGDEIRVESEAFSAQELYLGLQILLFIGAVGVLFLRRGILGISVRLFVAVLSAAALLMLISASYPVGLGNYSLFQQIYIMWEFFGLISMFWISCRTPRINR